MSPTYRFGIVGGCGATGRAALAELSKSCEGEILIGSRDLGRARAAAAMFPGRASAAQVDVLDSQSLDRFCRECSVILNCAGPVRLLQDRVAQAALRGHCHYVDVAGLMFVKEGMLPHARTIADSGLSFVISAGWLPGITELLPAYAHEQARTLMDTIESVTVYFGDSGKWSAAAYQDMAWFLRRTGLRRPGYFRNGLRVRAGMMGASPRVDLGGRVGSRRFTLFAMPELDEMAAILKDCDVVTYSYMPGVRAALAAAAVAIFPMPEALAVRLLQWALRRDTLPFGGFVAVEVAGLFQGRARKVSVETVYDKLRDYWTNALVAATVARMIAEGKGARTGVHFLASAVNPTAFVAELSRAGLDTRLDWHDEGTQKLATPCGVLKKGDDTQPA
jgi:hypothetical protein